MFKIGDFSRLTRVSVRMLRHYDEIGLLKSQLVDELTGYRFYSADQISRLNHILVLKEMGFSLSEISGLMHNDLDSQQLLSLLSNRQREISDTITKEKEKLLRVETLIKSISQDDLTMKYEIVLKDIPAYKVISLRDTIQDFHDQERLCEELMDFAKQNKLKCIKPFYTIYHDCVCRESDLDIEITACISGDSPETGRIKQRVLEAVPEMAVVMHQGPFEESNRACQALGVWLEANSYLINGPFRATGYKGPCNEQDPANYLTEIQVPVMKKK